MGDEERLPERLEHLDEREFPNLVDEGYYVTSPATEEYNCIAYVVGEQDRKWEPYLYYWPKNAQVGHNIDALVSAMEAVGFEKCAAGEPENGIEKIALYVDKKGQWTHAAKQLQDGMWSSKIGDIEDIRHRTPYSLQSNIYGQVMYFMRRTVQSN